MLRRLTVPIVLFAVASAASAALAEVPHVQGGDTPRDGTVTLEARALWQRGQEDDDLIFGAVNSVQTGPDGNLYVLDQQLSQVDVFAPDDGTLLRTLSREGEGPGESRRPEHMVFFADGTLGLAQYISGRIVHVDLQGTPLGTIMPPGSPEGDGLANIRRVRCRGGNLVVNGVRNKQAGEGMERTQYLVHCEPDGTPGVEYLSSTASTNVQRDGWIEKGSWFPSHERWDLDDRGFVYAAADRDAYLVDVFAPDGTLVRTFGRDEEPVRRTEAEKQEIRDSVVVLADGQRLPVEVKVEDTMPVIAEIHCRPGGEVWVSTTRGRRDQPEGVMMTFDVFDRDGAYVRRAAVAVPGDPKEDRLYLLPGDRLALVRGAVQARRNTFGGSRGEEAEVPVHDLTLYAY